ncbi:MAG: DinB family protein [Lewinellaceae bacterium]|nr:DinB family protein [Lewinellaceae bacterium]
MKKKILEQNAAYHHQVEALLNALASTSDAVLNQKPADGGWSAIQVLHHLIVSEELSLRYVQKKLGFEPTLEKAGLAEWLRARTLWFYLNIPIKFKAPPMVGREHLPDFATLADTKARWMDIRQKWAAYIGQMPSDMAEKAVYRHPLAGRLSWSGMLTFFRCHFERHLKQIRRTLRHIATGNPLLNMNKLTLLLFLLLPAALQAQVEPDKNDLAPCGTVSHIDDWLKKYLTAPHAFPESTDTLWTGLQIHLLANDNGTGRFGPDRMLDAFHRLNEDFGPSGIRFYFKNDWNLINNSAWFQHDSLVQGIAMMFANNVPDVLNTYFVVKAAGNCAYNLPYAGVATTHSCTGPNDHTWTHEIGHALSIQHPFIGWEGKIYIIGNPTPDTLTYDYTHFHSTPDTIVPAPLDTALVEYVDGSNCGIAADRICDTGPDYLSYRWACNAQGLSNVQQKDPAGATFYSDGTLFMSYSTDNCQNRFSAQQTQIMRAKLLTDKAAWLAPQAPAPVVTAASQLLSPINNTPAPTMGAQLRWASVPGATHYLVQVSKVSSYSAKDFEAIVTDTFALTGMLTPNWATTGVFGRSISVPSGRTRPRTAGFWPLR